NGVRPIRNMIQTDAPVNPGNSGGGSNNSAVARPTPTAQAGGAPIGGASTNAGCLSAAEIYAALRPAVVEVLSRSGSSDFGLPRQGAGSGIVIDDQGSVLTNNHVVDGADQLEVRFADGTVVSAQIVGTDPGNDLAVIVIDADTQDRDLTVATLGDSASLRVGDPVLAIGSPFNLEGTLTQGIVSSLGRTFSAGNGVRPIRNMIQTDAPVNPGNSGGPLIDCHGEVVGINTLIENPTGDNVNVGIAFAVPINTAKSNLSGLMAGQTVEHAWLGIAGQELTPALADQLGLSIDHGIYVTVVSQGSPADDAGVRGAFASEQEAAQSDQPAPGGDVIVSADGNDVRTIDDLAGYLDQNKRPGDTVQLGVARAGEDLTLEATLGQWPS
ncbi:MAG TPA: trypsin-like peptidase domain-containing protein, partial [Dehalococcoidia bacterium]|nr:trypsin-like peptidase domain-containing protein [Dehalococcoidia bacterium]